MYVCFYIIPYFVFIFQLVSCKFCHFNNLLTEAGVMREAVYVYSIFKCYLRALFVIEWSIEQTDEKYIN